MPPRGARRQQEASRKQWAVLPKALPPALQVLGHPRTIQGQALRPALGGPVQQGQTSSTGPTTSELASQSRLGPGPWAHCLSN